MSAADYALKALRTRITRVFPAQVRAAVEPLDDEQIWWRPNESSNSIGNLILHLAGSLNLYLNRNIGGIEYTRDRDAEFAERKRIPKAELLAIFDDMVARAEQTFASLTVERLAEPSPVPKMHDAIAEDLVNAFGHLANHVGQIVWIAKMLRETPGRELWMDAHRQQGAWKS